MRRGDTSLGGARDRFQTTVWDHVRRAGDPSSQVRQAAFQELCERYWKPIYRTVRIAWAKPNEDAKDLTQAFFLWLMEGEAVRRYAPERGSFRVFLRALVKHFVMHKDEAMGRLKRGGGLRFVDLDQADRDWEGVFVDRTAADPGEVFDRSWRVELLSEALNRVRRRSESPDKAVRFQVFERYDLSPLSTRPTHEEIARALGIKATDVMNHLAAIREEVRLEVRALIEETTSGPDELEEEWREFLRT